MTIFYRCPHCGNIMTKLHNSGVLVVCCGDEMLELEANTVDASIEKHVPVLNQTAEQVEVKIGSEPHPMTDDHHIEWIYLETVGGGQIFYLQAGTEPVINALSKKPITTVYAYCNLHGLWKS